MSFFFGCMFFRNDGISSEIDKKVSASSKILAALGKCTHSVNLSVATKRALYKGVLLFTLMDGSKC